MAKVTANLVLDLRKARRLVEILGPVKFPKVLLASVKAMQLALAEHVITTKLTGQRLNRRTGTLIRSVSASTRVKPEVRRAPARVRGTVGTPLRYGGAHEEGFTDEVEVRAHTRRLSKAQAALYDAPKGFVPIAKVRAHTRRMNVRAKWYLRDSLIEKKPLFREFNARAIAHAIRTGKVPSAATILAGAK